MNSNYYGNRFTIGAFFDWPIGLLRRHRFISFVICSCVNVFLVFDTLVYCGYFIVDNSANSPVRSSSYSFVPSALSSEATPNKDVRLLCWISSPFIRREKENPTIRVTWGKRCDKFIFFTNSSDITANQTENKVNVSDGIVWLFARTSEDVWKYLHDHYLNDFDWFLKADAGTYVVVDQLKVMLSIRDPAAPSYLAATANNKSEMIGDAYVLSRESIRRLVRQFRRRNPVRECDDWMRVVPKKGVSSNCLNRLGIFSQSTLDDRGCQRFLDTNLAIELINNNNKSIDSRCISEKVVVFARLGEHDFYFYEHLLYRLKLPSLLI